MDAPARERATLVPTADAHFTSGSRTDLGGWSVANTECRPRVDRDSSTAVVRGPTCCGDANSIRPVSSVLPMEAAPRPDQWKARSGYRAGGLGAFSAAAAVVMVMPAFYPLARLFDPSAGGDEPTGLVTELAIGAVGGVLLSPVAAAIGAVVGLRIGNRRVGPGVTGALVAVAIGLAVCVFVALNGGLIDESGSASSLLFVTVLGALAGAAAVMVFVGARRIVPVE
jgi:hypothetical protein